MKVSFNIVSFLRIKLALKESAMQLRYNEYLNEEVKEIKSLLAQELIKRPSNLTLR